MSASHAVFPGTFDPPTLGHLDLVRRACALFDRVTVAVARHPIKDQILDPDQRRALFERVLAASDLEGRVDVVVLDGLLVEGCRRLGATVILRGLRGGLDLEYERPMVLTNRSLAEEIETVFLLPEAGVAHISSTLVRQIARMGGDVSPFVPPPVTDHLRELLEESP